MSERRKPDEEVESDAERPTNVAGAKVVRIDSWTRKHRRQPIEPDDDTSGPDPGPSAA